MANARPRPQVMRLTDAAAERIKAVMANAERPIAAVSANPQPDSAPSSVRQIRTLAMMKYS